MEKNISFGDVIDIINIYQFSINNEDNNIFYIMDLKLDNYKIYRFLIFM